MKYDDEGRLMINLGAAAVFGPGASTDNAIVRWDGATGTAIQDSLVTINDAGDVTLPQDIIHAGDADTYLRFTNDRLRVVVGGVDILDITEAGADTVVWNEGGVDVDFRVEGVGAPNALFVQGSDGKVGIGTGVIPHGGVGYAILALEGTASNAAGPHVQFTTATDDYPLLQIVNWAHDSISIFFDSYFDGSYRSSDAGSNFLIEKGGTTPDHLTIAFDTGVAQGAVITWNNGIVLDTAGRVGINNAALVQQFNVAAGSGTNICGFFSTHATTNEMFIGGSMANDDSLVIGFNQTGDYGYLAVWGDVASLRINDGGAIQIATLAGVGNRNVVADANGVLSAP